MMPTHPLRLSHKNGNHSNINVSAIDISHSCASRVPLHKRKGFFFSKTRKQFVLVEPIIEVVLVCYVVGTRVG